MYKVIKKEIFEDGEIVETTYLIKNDFYMIISIDEDNWEEFKKAVAEAK